MTCGCNGLLSSFNLARNPCLWKQGGDSGLRRLTVYRRNYRAAKTGLCSVNTIVVIYYLSGRPQRALSFTGCRRHCASEERRRCDSAHANTNRYLAPSNVHVIFRKTLLTAESWDCTQWWEQPILYNRRSTAEAAKVTGRESSRSDPGIKIQLKAALRESSRNDPGIKIQLKAALSVCCLSFFLEVKWRRQMQSLVFQASHVRG